MSDVINALGPAEGRRLLDFGCASGSIAGALGRRGFDVVGCDISLAMIAEATSRHGEAALFQHVDGRLPFEQDRFDVVIAISVLEYVQDASVLSDLVRVLRPGGTFFVTVPNPHHPARWLEAAVRRVIPGPVARSAERLGGVGAKVSSYQRYLAASRRRPGPAKWRSDLAALGLDNIGISRLPSKSTMLCITAIRAASSTSN